MKKLCFGTLLNLVYQAKDQGVTYKSICDAVFSAYGCADTTNRDSSSPPHLKSGHDNVPHDVIYAAQGNLQPQCLARTDRIQRTLLQSAEEKSDALHRCPHFD